MTPPLAPPKGMLTTAHFHVIQEARVQLDGDVDGDFLGRGAQHFAETVVQVEAGRGFVKAGFGRPARGSSPVRTTTWCLPKVRPPVSLCHLRGGGSDAGVEMCGQEGL